MQYLSLFICWERGSTYRNPSLRPRGKMWGQQGMLRVLIQGTWGLHLGPNGIGLNKLFSPGPGGWKDIPHLVSSSQVQGHRPSQTYLVALFTVERGWVPGLRLWECHYLLRYCGSFHLGLITILGFP